MAFQLTPLRIPNMTTDFSAETRAMEGLGQTLGNLIPNIQKQRKAEVERQEFDSIGKGLSDGTLDYNNAAGRLVSLGRVDAGFELLKLGETQKQRLLGQDAVRSLGERLGADHIWAAI